MKEPTIRMLVEEYVLHLRASGRTDSPINQAYAFMRWCKANFPEESVLTQAMIDLWWMRGAKESAASHRSRVYKALPLLRYTISAFGIEGLAIPSMPEYAESRPSPHFFTKEELMAFFSACDSLAPCNSSLQQKLRKAVVPVIFRLLYSSGIRVGEARKLKREDVDFQTGITAVKETKGGKDHFIVLHPTMLALLNQYDSHIESIMPGRTYLFPNASDQPYRNKWLSDQFRACWYRNNKQTAYARELRHQYAIENIDSWPNEDYDTWNRIVALMNSMGHAKLSRTLYYYSLAPCYHELLESKCGRTYNTIIPSLGNETDK